MGGGQDDGKINQISQAGTTTEDAIEKESKGIYITLRAIIYFSSKWPMSPVIESRQQPRRSFHCRPTV